MSGPETINTDSGKWMRRDVFLDEFVNNDNQIQVNKAFDDLINDGSFKQRTFGDDKYVQLNCALAAYKTITEEILEDRGLFVTTSDLNE